MSKQTNLLLQVPDDVYYQLVEPMKKAKRFTKLIVTLLQGYMSNKYIHDYADDTLEEGRRVTFEAFNSSLAEAEEALARMGMIGDELQSTNEAGSLEFTKKREQTIEEMNSQGLGNKRKFQEDTQSESEAPGVSVSDFETLSKRVDGLESTISQNFEKLFGLLAGTGELTTKSSPTQVKPVETNSVSRNAAEAVALAVQSIEPSSDAKPNETSEKGTGLVVGEGFLNDVFSVIGFQS